MTETLHTDVPLRDQLMTIEEVAELLRMPVATLRYWRVLDSGPCGFIIGRRLRYWRQDCHGLARRPARVHRVRSRLIHPQERRSLSPRRATGATADP